MVGSLSYHSYSKRIYIIHDGFDFKSSRLQEKRNRVKKETLEKFPRFLCPIIGGVREIRTLAGLTTSNDLANRPLQPLEYHSIYRLTRLVYYKYIRMSINLKRKWRI